MIATAAMSEETFIVSKTRMRKFHIARNLVDHHIQHRDFKKLLYHASLSSLQQKRIKTEHTPTTKFRHRHPLTRDTTPNPPYHGGHQVKQQRKKNINRQQVQTIFIDPTLAAATIGAPRWPHCRPRSVYTKGWNQVASSSLRSELTGPDTTGQTQSSASPPRQEAT